MKTPSGKSSRSQPPRNGRHHPSPDSYETENSLPKSAREELVVLLQQHLADSIDLQSHLKQAHRNVTGPNLVGLHELFDKAARSLDSYVELIGERIRRLGGNAPRPSGTAVASVTAHGKSRARAHGGRRVEADARRTMATFNTSLQAAMNEPRPLKAPKAPDLLTQASGTVEQWLWIVEPHLDQPSSPAHAPACAVSPCPRSP